MMMLLTMADGAAAVADVIKEQAGLWTAASAMALVTLTLLEIILGVDNVVFIALVAGKLPRDQQVKARNLGLALAAITRVLLLLSVFWVAKLDNIGFTLFEKTGWEHTFTVKDCVLLAGGLFLIWKAVHEIHAKVEHASEGAAKLGGGAGKAVSFGAVVGQILLIDIIFSLDSVITAVGMAQRIEVMIAAVLIALAIMVLFAGKISGIIERHPTLKMLALSFLILIGVMLVADGMGHHIPKGYVYFAMAFSLGVEMLNLKIGARPLGKPAGVGAGAGAGVGAAGAGESRPGEQNPSA